MTPKGHTEDILPALRKQPAEKYLSQYCSVGLIDEGWLKRGAHVAGDPGAYVIDMGRIIGTAGETHLRIIVRPGTTEVISAYPWIP